MEPDFLSLRRQYQSRLYCLKNHPDGHWLLGAISLTNTGQDFLDGKFPFYDKNHFCEKQIQSSQLSSYEEDHYMKREHEMVRIQHQVIKSPYLGCYTTILN